MKKILFLLGAFVLFCSHDMFLKLDTYFLSPNAKASIKLFNGTFKLSENTIDRNRMIDVSLVGNGKRAAVDTTQWTEQAGATILNFTTGESGTWVAGVSTRPRNIEMEATAFNDYLKHDGILDMLEWRTENNALNQDAVEKYSKHVKTIFQVGDAKTEDWKTELGYPIEFIPLSNPYNLKKGDQLKVQLLLKGEPLPNHLAYVGVDKPTHSHDETHDHDHGDEAHSHDHDHSGEAHSHEHDHDDEAHSHDHEKDEKASSEDHEHDEVTQFQTNEAGVLTINIDQEGVWFLRTIHLALSEEPGLTHESNWATLTFEVGHGHTDAHHHHEHADATGIPGYLYWIGSAVVVLGLFFWFNRKEA